MPALWIVGALLAAMGSIASNMGVNVQVRRQKLTLATQQQRQKARVHLETHSLRARLPPSCLRPQKYSFLKNAKLEPEFQKPYLRQPLSVTAGLWRRAFSPQVGQRAGMPSRCHRRS